MTARETYDRATIALHWTTAILVVLLWIFVPCASGHIGLGQALFGGSFGLGQSFTCGGGRFVMLNRRGPVGTIFLLVLHVEQSSKINV